MDADSELTESYKQQIAEQATIYKKTEKRELKEFEKKVNEAAVELCLRDATLLRKRGELLEKARKRVAEDGYCFKKGCSRSKVYGGSGTSSTPKRPKFDKEMREERIKQIQDDLNDLSRVLAFKEKRLAQCEAARNYRVCEQVTEEMMELKSRKRQLEVEKHIFEKKKKQASAREVRIRRASESDDTDCAPASSNTSRSTTPAGSLSRSTTPGGSLSRSATPVPVPLVAMLSSCSDSGGKHASPLPLENVSPPFSPNPISPIPPTCPGSRMLPIDCESTQPLSPLSPASRESSVDPFPCGTHSDSDVNPHF